MNSLAESEEFKSVIRALDQGDALEARRLLLALIDAFPSSVGEPSLQSIYWRMANSWAKRSPDGSISDQALQLYRKLSESGIRVETPAQGTRDPQLKAELAGVLGQLPPFDYTPRENEEPDFYGAVDCIAHELGMARPLASDVTWTHGWSRSEDFLEGDFNVARNKKVNNLVYTERIRGEMAKLGYTKLYTVGAPIIYATQTEVPRIPGSVLFVPQHSSESMAYDQTDSNSDGYSDILDEFRGNSLFAVCVGAKDVLLGNFIQNLEKRRIPWVTGAWIFDRNALVRMQRIFRSFEYMVSDTIGSHIAYAAYCGCKVILRDSNRQSASKATLYDYRQNWQKEERKKLRSVGLTYLKEIAPFLFGTKESAKPEVEWGKNELGYSHKKDAKLMAGLLGWSPERMNGSSESGMFDEFLTQGELVGLAMKAESKGSFELADRVLSKVLSRNPNFGLAHFLKARNLCRREVYEDASKHASRAIECGFSSREAIELKEAIDAKLAPTDPFLNPPQTPNTMDLYFHRKSVLDALKSYLPILEGTFLDVGCSVMPYKSLITNRPSRVNRYLGMDIETDIHSADVDICWDGQKIPLEDDSVDSAMATEVLEHCPEPMVVLKEIRRVLKPGGVFFFTVPYIWPLHDAPWDFYRYTPFSLKRLLKEAGFESPDIKALSGWDASLAQMMGLWLKRAPMSNERRNAMAQKLWPIYQELVQSDQPPADPEAGNTMTTGWHGTAFKPAVSKALEEIPATELPVIIVRSHKHNYSETFIEDHVNHISSKRILVYGWPLPRFDESGRSVLDEELEKRISSALASNQPLSPELRESFREGIAQFIRKSGAKAALLESGLMGVMWHEACHQAGLPYVVHFHGVDAFGSDILQQFGSAYRSVFRHARAVVGVSLEMVEQLKSLGASPDQIVHGPYGVSVELDRLADPARAKPVFLAVGRFVDKKSPQSTLRAFQAIHKKVSEARLIMVGDGPLLPICQQWVKEQKLEDAVTFAGVQSRQAVSRLMSMSRVFVQHSVCAENGDREGLPLSILEAGAHGLPVVATRHAGIPDAVREGVDGFLVDEGDVLGMAKAMLQLATQPDLAGQMGRSFRERVCEHYSRAVSIERLQTLLSSVIEGEAPSSQVKAEPKASTSSQTRLDNAQSAPEAWGFAQKAREAGDSAAAITAAELAVSLDRNFTPAYLYLGQQMAAQGSYEEAYLYMREASRVGKIPEQAEKLLRAMESNPELQTESVLAYRSCLDGDHYTPTEKPRRILVFTNLLPPQEMGGFGRSVWELCDGLIERGHQVRILTADVKELERDPYPGYERVERHVKRTLQLFGNWSNGIATAIDDQRRIQDIAIQNVQTILSAVKDFRPDVCMAGNLDFLGGLMLDPILAGNIPIVHRLGNELPGYTVDMTPKSDLYCIAGCSNWVNETLQRTGYHAARFGVLPPGSPLHEYYRLVPPRTDRLRICYAGLMMAYKGPHLILEALKLLKQLKIPFSCEFAGDFRDPKYEGQFKQRIHHWDLAAEVKLLGFCDRQKLAAMYARNNVLVFPSIFEEPFGKVQIEAQAAGLAVVRSPVGGYRDMIEDEVNGLLFKREDPEDLARQLYVLHNKPDFWQRLAARGQADAFRFATRNSVQILEEIFAELLECSKT